MNDELRTLELKLAEMRQAEAKFNEADAALQKFHAKGPQLKKKSGRPPFWKSFHGLFFVKEVDEFAEKGKSKVAFAAKVVRDRWCKPHSPEDPSTIATLAKQTHEELQVRYQEARNFWLFLLNREAYQKEEESLRNNRNEAYTAWVEAITSLRYLIRALRVRIGARNPYDFS
jgi:hypothetical protein